MLLKVKPLNSEIITIEMDEYNTIEDLQSKIFTLTGVLADTYRLVYKGKILKKESIINTLDINGTIFMVKSSKSKESNSENNATSQSSYNNSQFPIPPQTTPLESITPPQAQQQQQQQNNSNHFPIPPSSSPSIPNSFRDSLSSAINTLNQSQRNITNINSTISSSSSQSSNHLSLQLQQQRLILGQIFHRMSGIYMNSLSPLIITSNTLLNNNIPTDAVRNLMNILNDINRVNKMCCDMIGQYRNMLNQMNYEGTRIENNQSSLPLPQPQQQQQRNNNNRNSVDRRSQMVNNIVEAGANVARNIIGPLLGTGTNNIFHSVLQSINDTIFDISRMNNNSNNNNPSNRRNDSQIHHNEEID